jgi:hypothetical protein
LRSFVSEGDDQQIFGGGTLPSDQFGDSFDEGKSFPSARASDDLHRA